MPYKLILSLLLLSLLTAHTRSETRRIVGGDYTDIEDFPHSVYLHIQCKVNTKVDSWMCGSSVINQWLLLSAAHCVDGCVPNHTYVHAKAGHTDRRKAQTRLIAKYKCHEKYTSTYLLNDICVLMLKEPLELGATVKRVILMKNPPYKEKAKVTGWGFIDDENMVITYMLKKLDDLTIYSREQCRRTVPSVPIGAICARADALGEQHYTARGDSGSALVVRKSIQVGIISYCELRRSRTMTVYTDIGYHFSWIKKTVRDLMCTSVGIKIVK